MEALPLDPGSYGGTYKLVGGQPSLDFVNTVSWPGTEREHDWFDAVSNVTRWATEIGLIDADGRRRLQDQASRHPRKATEQLQAVRDLRRILAAVLGPLARGKTPNRRSIEDLNGVIAGACRRRRLDAGALRWSWADPRDLVELFAPVVWNAGEVVTDIDPKRLSYCPSCDWLFHDTTKNASRRWCDMGDCGSRDKALRYYHRHKTNGGSPGSR